MSAPTYELRLTDDQVDTLLRGLAFAEQQMAGVVAGNTSVEHVAFAGTTAQNALSRLRKVIEEATGLKVPEEVPHA